MPPSTTTLLLLVIHLLSVASPRPQDGAAPDDGEHTRTYNTRPDDGHTERHPHDPLRWVWIDDASLALEWPMRFSLSINGAVTAYRLSLTHPQHHHPFVSTTMYHVMNLRHQFEGLGSNMTYAGRLLALVGKHHWPYNLLNFTISSPSLLTGLGLGQRASYQRKRSATADLTAISVSVRLRWSPTPFRTGGFPPRFSDADGPPEPAVKPIGYRLQVWDRKRLIWEVNTAVHARDNGCEAAIGGLALDATYKVTLEALLEEDLPGTTLSFSLDAGALHVAGGGLTTDGVSECYSGLQVRCPNSERCVSPYWICDGAPDCPDGEDEVGCDKTPCDGFRCWDDTCVAAAWRCDGQRDCQDGDDEYACPQCGSEDLRCPKGGACLSYNSTCDGVYHCPDGWDESGAVCGSRSCGPNELRCLEGGRCVDHQRLCDGVPDCPTSEDEDVTFCAAFRSVKSITTATAATTSTSNSTAGYEGLPVQCEKGRSDVEVNCTHQEFKCDSGKCIRRLYLCNGIDDCENGEDERPTICTSHSTEVTKDHSRTYDSEEDVGDVYEYTGTKEEDLESEEDVDVAAPCQDGRLRCDEGLLCDEDQQLGCNRPSQKSSPGNTDLIQDGENATRSVNNNSLTVDNSTASGNQTWSTSEGIDQSLDYSNSLFPYFKHSGSLLGIAISNSTFEFLDDAGVSNLNATEDNDGISNGTLRNDSDINSVSRTQSTLEREDISLDGVDVSNEIVVEESFYPNSNERELDTASVEDYEDIRELNGTVSRNTDLLFISHNLTNATTTDNTTSVMDTPKDLDLNSTMPNLTTDGTVNNISNDYDSSSSFSSSSSSSSSYSSSFSEEYNVSDEIINSPSPILTTSDSNDTEEVDAGATHLDEASIFSTEEEDLDEFFNITALSPSDKEVITDHQTVINTPPDNETTVTPMPYDSVSSDVSPASYTPEDEETTEAAFTVTETQSSAVGVDNTTTPVPPDDVDGNSEVGIWATTTTAATLSELTPQATNDALTTTSTATTTATSTATATTTTTTSAATTTTVTTFPPSPYREDPTIETSTEDVTTYATQTPTEEEEGRSTSTTTPPSPPSRGTEGTSADGTELMTTTSSFVTEPNNWKDASLNQKNLTILIAIHSEMNESKVPEYIIQGMDGKPYQYEIVSIVKDDEFAPDSLEMDKTSHMLREEEEADGSHGYLQGSNISSAKRCTLSLISLILTLFLHKL